MPKAIEFTASKVFCFLGIFSRSGRHWPLLLFADLQVFDVWSRLKEVVFPSFSVAKLPDKIIIDILELQRRLIDSLHLVTEAEFKLLEQYGETSETLSELEDLQNIRERLTPIYSRLHVLLLKVAESQPVASNDVLNLLYDSIERAEVLLDSGAASLREIQDNWSDL